MSRLSARFDCLPLRRYALLRYGGLSLMEPRIQYASAQDTVSNELPGGKWCSTML